MAARSVLVIAMAMLLTAVAVRTDNGEQKFIHKPEELPGDSESKARDTQDNPDVDIAALYETGQAIWIFGVGLSSYPCMVDFVHETTGNTTLFKRYHWETKGEIMRSRELIGHFTTKPPQRNPYNAMNVERYPPPARGTSSVKSWKSSEVMLYQSADKSCGLFLMSYTESPDNRSPTDQKDYLYGPHSRGTEAKVEYNFRVKNGIVKMSQEKTCLQDLKTQYDAERQKKKTQEIEIPEIIQRCKAACQRDDSCKADRASGQSKNSPAKE